MRLIKQYWYVGLLLLGTIGLGATTLLISVRLQQAQPVTPEEPHAQVANTPTPSPNPACILAFAIANPPTNTPGGPTPSNTPIPTNTPTPIPRATNTPTPTNSPEPTATNTPTPTPTPTVTPTSIYTPTPTNTPAPGTCSGACTTNSDCANNLVCNNGMCRNAACTDQPNCACYYVPTPKVPVTGMGTTVAGIGVIGGGLLLLLLGLAF